MSVYVCVCQSVCPSILDDCFVYMGDKPIARSSTGASCHSWRHWLNEAVRLKTQIFKFTHTLSPSHTHKAFVPLRHSLITLSNPISVCDGSVIEHNSHCNRFIHLSNCTSSVRGINPFSLGNLFCSVYSNSNMPTSIKNDRFSHKRSKSKKRSFLNSLLIGISMAE